MAGSKGCYIADLAMALTHVLKRLSSFLKLCQLNPGGGTSHCLG